MKSLFKYILIQVLMLIVTGVVYAQTPLTNYFIESSYTRGYLNPALRPNSGYIGFPALSGMSVNYKTNTFNLDNFTSNIGGERVTFMHNDVSTADFMSNISDDNYISLGTNIDILGFGWYKGSTFWNVNVSLKGDVEVNLPKNLFRLLKEGYAQDSQSEYDLKDISATGNTMLEVGLSYSRPFLDDALTLGARAKMLGGVANFDLHAEELSIEAGPEQWRARSRVKLNVSAPGIDPTYDDDGIIDGFDTGNWSGLSGYGFGLDLGAVYDFSKSTLDVVPVLRNLRASVALNDIGFISWSEANSALMKSPDTDVTINPGDYEIHTDGSTSLEDIFEDVTDDLTESVNLHEDKKGGRTTSLRSTLNMGLEYLFLDNKLSAGLLYSNRFGNYFNTQELTVSGNYRPAKWLAASLSYSFLHSNFNTFGGALYLTPGKVLNFFIAGDYVISHVSPQYIPSTSKALNVQFGISIPM